MPVSTPGYQSKGMKAYLKASLKQKYNSFLLDPEHFKIGSLTTVLTFLLHVSSQNIAYNLTKRRNIFLQLYIQISFLSYFFITTFEEEKSENKHSVILPL